MAFFNNPELKGGHLFKIIKNLNLEFKFNLKSIKKKNLFFTTSYYRITLECKFHRD